MINQQLLTMVSNDFRYADLVATFRPEEARRIREQAKALLAEARVAAVKSIENKKQQEQKQ